MYERAISKQLNNANMIFFIKNQYPIDYKKINSFKSKKNTTTKDHLKHKKLSVCILSI